MGEVFFISVSDGTVNENASASQEGHECSDDDLIGQQRTALLGTRVERAGAL